MEDGMRIRWQWPVVEEWGWPTFPPSIHGCMMGAFFVFALWAYQEGRAWAAVANAFLAAVQFIRLYMLPEDKEKESS